MGTCTHPKSTLTYLSSGGGEEVIGDTECVFYLPFRRFYTVVRHEAKWRKAWELDPFPILNPKFFLPLSLSVCVCFHTQLHLPMNSECRGHVPYSLTPPYSWDRGSFLGPLQAYCLCLPRCQSGRYSRPCLAWDWQRTKLECMLEQQALLPAEPSSQSLFCLILFKFWESVLREL